MLRFVLFINCFWVSLAIGQFSLQNIQDSYFQDFGTSPITNWQDNTTFPGWYKDQGVFQGEINVSTAAPNNAGGLYAYSCNGLSDRKIGFRPANSSGGPCSNQNCGHAYGVRIQNQTGVTINAITLSYEGFQLSEVLDGGNQNKILVDYSIGNNLNALALGNNGWNNIPNATYFAPIINGTCGASQVVGIPCEQSQLISTCFPVSIAPGEEIMIRFLKSNEPCNDPHLAIDNVSIDFHGDCIPPILATPQNVITCAYFVFPPIQGTNLSGNEAYYLQNGGTGNSFLPGDTLFSAGNHTIYIYDENTGANCQGILNCNDEVSFLVEIEPALNLSFNLPSSFCEFEIPPNLPVNSNENISGSWSNVINTQLVGQNTITFTPNTSGCFNNFSYEYIVHALPQVQITGDSLYCFGETTELSIGNGFTSILWSNGSANSPEQFTESDNPVSVTVEDSNGCSVTSSLTVFELPEIISYDTLFLCGANTVEVHGQLVNEEGTYEAIYLGTNGCDSLSLVSVIAVNDLSVFFEVTPTSNCNDDNGSLLLTGFDTGENLTLSLNNDNFNLSADGSGDVMLSSLSFGQYIFTVTNEKGCSYSDSFSIAQFGLTFPDFTVTGANCYGENTGIIAFDDLPNGWDIQWLGGLPNTNSQSELFAGNYSVTVTNPNNCSADSIILVPDGNNFQPILSASSLIIIEGETISIAIENLPITNIQSTKWYYNDELLDCLNCSEISHQPSIPGNYTVIITDENGCIYELSIWIEVLPNCSPIFPTIFSPNNDGKNDLFCDLSNCEIPFQLLIYNRWGELIFENSENSDCWNGSFKNAQVQPGTYVFTVRYKDAFGEEKLEKGNISIIY
ncbi:MAG: gliding motility-associated C-terminal domain-containing protein [Crocinitomicaceae bacterium]|nr:gliding motility-associated C-terminal domain-containing protein [Crocinitomicaceae bacterium]